MLLFQPVSARSLLSWIISFLRPHGTAIFARNTRKAVPFSAPHPPKCRFFWGVHEHPKHIPVLRSRFAFFFSFRSLRAPLASRPLAPESVSERELQEMRKTRHPRCRASAPDDRKERQREYVCACVRAYIRVCVCVCSAGRGVFKRGAMEFTRRRGVMCMCERACHGQTAHRAHQSSCMTTDSLTHS